LTLREIKLRYNLTNNKKSQQITSVWQDGG
jgi:hypothetical protein